MPPGADARLAAWTPHEPKQQFVRKRLEGRAITGNNMHTMFGLLNIRKTSGPTSHDVVARVRRLLGRQVKVGHAGTLDPFAEGVLVICVGPATRLADYVQAAPKRYLAEVTLGSTSTTDDPEGQIAPTAGAAAPAESLVREAAEGFVGEIEQVPPAHSAVHVDGRRAYKLARSGQTLDLPARTVTIYSVEVVEYDYPRLVLDVRCGVGTYIRALARDIGQALGVGGYCSALTRTAVGDFAIDQALDIEEVDPGQHLIDPLAALGHLPRVVADEQAVEQIRHGRAFAAEAAGPEIAVTDEAGRLLAIAIPAGGEGMIRPKKVFLTEQ